jgi:hypothetical protein
MNLSDPKDARAYIDQFEIPGAPSKPSYIELNTGKRIEFATMTDDEACVAAHLLHDLVIEAGMRAIKH